MFSTTPSGFSHASFSKGTLLILSFNTVLMGIFKSYRHYDLALFPHIIPGNQFLRLFTSNLGIVFHHFKPQAFSSSAQLFLGSLLLYNFRILERQWGTSKFASVLFVATAMTTSLDILALTLLRTYVSRLAHGPIGTILTLAWMYISEIPVLYHIKLAGVQVSDHFFFILMTFVVISNPLTLFSFHVCLESSH